MEVDSLDPEVISGVLRRMISDGLQVVEFHREERKLEDAFIEILGSIESGNEPGIGKVAPPPPPPPES